MFMDDSEALFIVVISHPLHVVYRKHFVKFSRPRQVHRTLGYYQGDPTQSCQQGGNTEASGKVGSVCGSELAWGMSELAASTGSLRPLRLERVGQHEPCSLSAEVEEHFSG